MTSSRSLRRAVAWDMLSGEGVVTPGSASLGNLTVTTAAGRTTSKTNTHLLSVVTAEVGAIRVKVGIVAAETKIYCAAVVLVVVPPTRVRDRVMQQGEADHTQQTYVNLYFGELQWLTGIKSDKINE